MHSREQARAEHALTGGIEDETVIEAICAAVQGGYVTARLSDDPGAQRRACHGLIGLLGWTGDRASQTGAEARR